LVGTPLSNEVEDEVKEELAGVVDCATAIAAKRTAKNMTIDESCSLTISTIGTFKPGETRSFIAIAHRQATSSWMKSHCQHFIQYEVTCQHSSKMKSLVEPKIDFPDMYQVYSA
jgi:hypothetical protein